VQILKIFFDFKTKVPWGGPRKACISVHFLTPGGSAKLTVSARLLGAR
jgi:hypothetical protein